MDRKGYPTTVGDEGGFAPNVTGTEEALNLIQEAIVAAGYEPGTDVLLALGLCRLRVLQGRQLRVLAGEGLTLTATRIHRLPRHACGQVPDRLDRGTRWPRTTGLAGSTSPIVMGKRVQLVGDDLFVTNTKILAQGIDQGIANSILIKINQIGTLTEPSQRWRWLSALYTAVISHRSGETEDSTIADIAVGLKCDADQDGLRSPA